MYSLVMKKITTGNIYLGQILKMARVSSLKFALCGKKTLNINLMMLAKY